MNQPLINISMTKNIDALEKDRAEKKEQDLSKARDARCEPLAEQILQIFASAKPTAESTREKDHAKQMEVYAPIVRDILQAMLDADIQANEVEYTMSIVQAMLTITTNRVMQSFEKSFREAEERTFGKPMAELTLSALDGILKVDEE